MDIVEQMRSFESDHEPDGWPAIQMKQVSALCDEVERLQSLLNGIASEVERLQSLLEQERQESLTASCRVAALGMELDSATSIIEAANAQEPFCTITHTAEEDLKTYRTELHYREDVTIASIPSHLALYASPIPAQQSPDAQERINSAECSARTWQMSYEQVVKKLERLQKKAVTIPYVDVTDDMMHAAFKHSKIGGYVRSNWTRADDAITEIFKVMLDAAPKQSPAVAVPDFWREEWKENVMALWVLGRKYNSSIPDDVLDFMRDSMLKMLERSKSPRITEHDAREIIKSFEDFADEGESAYEDSSWWIYMDWKCRELLDKLNKVSHETN